MWATSADMAMWSLVLVSGTVNWHRVPGASIMPVRGNQGPFEGQIQHLHAERVVGRGQRRWGIKVHAEMK